jgi:hypothetical protein
MGTTSSHISPGRFKSLAKTSPKAAAGYLHCLPDFLDGDSQTRRAAMQGVVTLSTNRPFSLQTYLPAILGGLRDVDEIVRANTLAALSNVVSYYPHRFSNISPQFYESLTDGTQREQVYAAMALGELARQRPDLVSPRTDVLEQFEQILGQQKLHATNSDVPDIDIELIREGQTALLGGDLESRPLEADLSPVGRVTELSFPARLAIISATLPLTIIFSTFFILGKIIKPLTKRAPSRGFFLSQLFSISVWKSGHQFRLLFRCSPVLMPCEFIQWLPGESPVEPQQHRAPPLPEEWDTIVQAVWERDEKTCRNCHAETHRSSDANPFVETKIPVQNGGSYHPSNLRTLCGACQQIRKGYGVSNHDQ